MIIYLPIEIKDREYLPKLLLTHYILKSKKKSCVIISRSRLARHKIENYKNAIYFDKSLSMHKTEISNQIIRKNILSVLDEEAPIFNWVSYMKDIRLPLNILKKTHLYFVMGQVDKTFIENKYKQKFNNVKIVGHPKYDLLNHPFYNFHKEEVEIIKKRFKEFIFIPLSFIHDLKGSDDYSKYLIKEFAINKNLKKKLKDSIKSWDYDFKNYSKFLNCIEKLAKENQSINFILRPHPTQDIEKIKNRIKKKTKNLHIIYKYSITPWILACDYYLHSHCTSVYEAAKLKKKIFCLNLNKKNMGVHLLKNPGYNFNNTKTFELFFKNFLKKKIKYNFQKIALDKNFLFNYKNNSSCREILKYYSAINKSKGDVKLDFQINSYIKFKILIKKFIFSVIKLRNLIFPENDHFKKKYFELKTKDVEIIIKKFSKLDKSKYKFYLEELDKDVVMVTNYFRN